MHSFERSDRVIGRMSVVRQICQPRGPHTSLHLISFRDASGNTALVPSKVTAMSPFFTNLVRPNRPSSQSLDRKKLLLSYAPDWCVLCPLPSEPQSVNLSGQATHPHLSVCCSRKCIAVFAQLKAHRQAGILLSRQHRWIQA